MDRRETAVKYKQGKTISLFLGFGLLFISAAYLLMPRDYARRLEATAGQTLSILAEMEADSIGRWTRKEIDLIQTFVDSTFADETVKKAVANLDGKGTQLALLSDRLAHLKKTSGFHTAYIITPGASLDLFGAGRPADLGQESMAHAYRCMASRNALFDDHITEDGGLDCFSLYVHIGRKNDLSPVCLLIRFDARALAGYLFGREDPSSLTRSMLLREKKDGFEVLFHKEGEKPVHSAIPFGSFSPAGKTPTAAKPVEGGLFTRRDVQGPKSLSAIMAIPGTDWFILVEQDQGILGNLNENTLAAFLPPSLILLFLAGAFLLFMLIREHKKAEGLIRADINSALASFNSSLVTVLDIAPNPVFRRDKKDIITHCNAAFEKLTCTPKSEIVGRDFYEFFLKKPSRRTSAGKTGDKPSVQVYEMSFTTPDEEKHELIVAESFISAAGGAVEESVGHVVDITQRKKTEQELIQLKEFSDETIRHMTEGLVLTDNDGRITFANQAAADILGYDPGEMIGMLEADLPPADQRGILEHMAERRLQGICDRYEIDMMRKDGRRRTILVSGGPRPSGEHPRGTMAILTDITERKGMEQEIRALSLTDDLTGLANRRGFTALAKQQLKIAVRMNRKAILFFLDLDDLKLINDNYGHRKGDQALIDIANLLKRNFRESDVLARYGGDEFVVLALEEIETEPDKIIKRLQAKLDAYNARAELEKSFKLFFSIGHVTFDPDFPAPIEDLLARADLLMYENKKAKKGL